MIELDKTFSIEAAHWLPHAPDGHKCHRLHGHSFAISVTVRGEPDAHAGWLIDYAKISSAFAPLHERLDHRLLNDIEGLENPTSENLARWCFDALRASLLGLVCVEVAETCTARCRYFEQESSPLGS